MVERNSFQILHTWHSRITDNPRQFKNEVVKRENLIQDCLRVKDIPGGLREFDDLFSSDKSSTPGPNQSTLNKATVAIIITVAESLIAEEKFGDAGRLLGKAWWLLKLNDLYRETKLLTEQNHFYMECRFLAALCDLKIHGGIVYRNLILSPEQIIRTLQESFCVNTKEVLLFHKPTSINELNWRTDALMLAWFQGIKLSYIYIQRLTNELIERFNFIFDEETLAVEVGHFRHHQPIRHHWMYYDFELFKVENDFVQKFEVVQLIDQIAVCTVIGDHPLTECIKNAPNHNPNADESTTLTVGASGGESNPPIEEPSEADSVLLDGLIRRRDRVLSRTRGPNDRCHCRGCTI